jgi:hypothetical protein
MRAHSWALLLSSLAVACTPGVRSASTAASGADEPARARVEVVALATTESAASHEALSARAASPAVRGGHWMLVPEQMELGRTLSTVDGRRLLLVGGTRWVDHPDGSIERAEQVLSEDNLRAIALPERLGKGYVFYADTGHATLIWRADEWTGALQPLAQVDPPVRAIVPGFDRLYLTGQTSHAVRAIDPKSGVAKDLAPLPAAATYAGMAFADSWFGVVLADVRGPLATFDAGESWHPLARPLRARDVSVLGSSSLAIDAEDGRFELGANGLLRQTSAEGEDALFRGARTFARYPADAFAGDEHALAGTTPFGTRPLKLAVSAGYPDAVGSAVVLARGALGRVRLADGKLLSLTPDAYTDVGPCRGIALGAGAGFVCGDERTPTHVLAYDGRRVTPVLTFSTPRTVRASGNGALVIEGTCAEREARASGSRSYCLRAVSGARSELRVHGELGRERVAALGDGRGAVLLVPRADDAGRLVLASNGSTREVELDLSDVSGARARLLRSGLWLNELVETGAGELGTWVVGAQAFVGVRVGLDGKVRAGKLEQGLEETLFSAGHALHFTGSVSLRETHDHGFEWQDGDLPPAVQSTLDPARSGNLRGCSPVGCVYDNWLRVGYADRARPPEAPAPERPPVVSHRPPGYAYWSLECSPSGVQQASNSRAPRARPKEQSVRRGTTRLVVPGDDDLDDSSWLSFFGAAPPRPAAGMLALDFGESTEGGAYRAYASGPRGSAWPRQSRWQVRALDPFSIDDSWATAWTQGPWNEARLAWQSFGLDASVSVEWSLDLEARGRSGAILMRTGSEPSLHLIDEGRPVVSLPSKAVTELGSPAGAVKVAGTWYLGSFKNKMASVHRVSEGQLTLLGQYPLHADDGRVAVRLIQSTDQSEIALWQRSSASGWFVFPLDRDSGEPAPALTLPLASLGRPPPACAAERAGWTMVANVPLTASGRSESNTQIQFSGGAEGLRTKMLRARVTVDDAGICLESLAARADGELPRAARLEVGHARAGSVHMTVSDDTHDLRWGFRCM